MPKVKINKKRCKGCQLCVLFCPKKNIKTDTVFNEKGILTVTVVDEAACSGCGLCFQVCPDVCIDIEG